MHLRFLYESQSLCESRTDSIGVTGAKLITGSNHSAKASVRVYLLDCDHGKGEVRKVTLKGVSIELAPEHSSCRVSVTSKSGSSLFSEVGEAIEVSPPLELAANNEEFLIVQIDTHPYEIVILRLGNHPAVISTLHNQYGFWIQNDCEDRRWHIWTADGAFADDPEVRDIYHYDLMVPEVVLAIRGTTLSDITPQCKAYIDRTIAGLATYLLPHETERFKMREIKDEFRAGQVKGVILYTALAQLYTGRATAARQTLNDQWPPADIDRIWQWMNRKRSEGILSEAK